MEANHLEVISFLKILSLAFKIWGIHNFIFLKIGEK